MLNLIASRLRAKLLDPETCIQCFARSRIEKTNTPQLVEALIDIAERYSKRTEIFVEAYALIYRDRDPLAEEKALLNRIALTRLGEIAKALEDIGRALEYLAKANAVDISMPWYEFSSDRYLEELDRVEVEYIGIDADPLNGVQSIAILLDNAGEAVIDLAFAYTVARRGIEVYAIARSEPYETDVTLNEALEIARAVAQLLRVEPRDVEILGTGSRYPAPAIDRVSSEVLDILRSVDLVISKGIANFEAFLEYRPIDLEKVLFLLKAKCPPIAKIFGIEMGRAVIAKKIL